ncbi:hypothetical protein EDD68_101189 [Melghiribacillus thermohalophilus]|uniref:Uncharacterized protein n=1 Tax=Melghiribacillus thermohalophilus TaxID=1324956 RepID=A0A4R3ND38_9BACI|nr:hypothetical protein [Melghiribacillus thermohalophilus]TCT26836.1 hypothetical protein EDD68_101189 [Melghiribacillus thermohalophilus]
MQVSKWAWIAIGNTALGIFTCYLYIYLWVVLEMEQGESILSWKAALSLIVGIIVFFIWNYFMLRKEVKKYWYHSIGFYFGTLLIFILFFISS